MAATTVFERNLAAFDLNLKTEQIRDGVLLVSSYKSSPTSLSPQEFFALETAARFAADAVYFRYFSDGRESVPQIYIYDNTDDRLSGKEAEIHTKVWSGCIVPMFIIISKTEVKIFDARESVQLKGGSLRTNPIETIKLPGEVIHRFSAMDFATGTFWEEKKNEDHFLYTTSAYKHLIDGLKRVYSDFQIESGLSPQVALKLLVQCLLVKYLEERDEEKDSGYFAKNYFKTHFKANTFCEVIANGQLLDLLDNLANAFNGKIFEWNKEEEKTERNAIKRAKVKKLADYLDGKSQNDQYVLWRLYSFSHLPVELISSVYEELLGKGKKDTVYTPDMLASTLVDECMPLKKPRRNFRLIDVSCGSGIFLVKAYKRVIQWWRYERWQTTGQMDKPDLVTMKQLLKYSIHGIDIQADAVRLSVFSLALALLDDLDPKTIWTKLKFENLSTENIVEKDFFEFINDSSVKDFDLVIGNPPFNPPNGLSNGAYYKHLRQEYDYKCEVEVPDYNLALIFLVEAMKLLKPSAILCFIQPSGPLLYQNDPTFKKAIFSKYNLLQVIDFTRLGDVIWGKANVATAAVFLQNSNPDNNTVAHITVQRTSANLKKLFLELDHYDFHFIGKEATFNDPFVWKANLLGGGRISSLIDRFSKLRTLKVFLKEKQSEGWAVGEGFIESDRGEKSQHITGYPLLPTTAFTEAGIDWTQLATCTIKKFHRPTNSKIYSPPHILLKANIGKKKLLVQFSENYVVFRDKIIGIHGPKEQKSELEKIYKYLIANSDVLRFYILSTSGQLSVNRATALLKEDLMRIPYPEDLSQVKISSADKILIEDILQNHFGSQGRELNQASANKKCIDQYSEIFTKALNSVYGTGKNQFRLSKTLEAGKYFALHFEYSENKKQTDEYEKDVDLERYIKRFIPSKSNKQKTHIQRILKYYSKDTIIIAKPKNLRYWLRSIALRDADETFADYLKTGF